MEAEPVLDSVSGRVSDRVLAAVASADDSDPLEFDERLAEVVDPDALDRLFGRQQPSPRVVFTYLGYDVEISGDGDVAVAPVED